MRQTSFSRAGVFALFASAVLFTAPAGAKDGRDFGGHYNLTKVIDKEGQVELTLALQLYNYSGADLKQAVIMLREAAPRPGVLGSFPPIKLWRNGKDVVVRRQVTIPRADFERWSTRVQPAVFVRYSQNGRAVERWAQLSRSPLILEARPPAAK